MDESNIKRTSNKKFNLRCADYELDMLSSRAAAANLPLSKYLVQAGLSDSINLSPHLQEHIEQIKFELGLLNHNVAALNDNFKLRELIADDQLNYLISYLSYSAKTLHDILSFQPNAAKKIFSPEAALNNFSKQHPGFDVLGNVSDLSPSSNPSSTNSSNQVNLLNKLSDSNESHQIPFDLFVALQFTTSKFSFFFSNEFSSNENISDATATNSPIPSHDDNAFSANTSETLTSQDSISQSSFTEISSDEILSSSKISPDSQNDIFVVSSFSNQDVVSSSSNQIVSLPFNQSNVAIDDVAIDDVAPANEALANIVPFNQIDISTSGDVSLIVEAPSDVVASGDFVSFNQNDALAPDDVVTDDQTQTACDDDSFVDDVDDVVSDEDDEDDFDEDDEFDLNDDRYDHLVPIDPPDFQGPYGDEDFDDSSIDPEENKKFMDRFMSLSKKEFRAYRDRLINNFFIPVNKTDLLDNHFVIINNKKVNVFPKGSSFDNTLPETCSSSDASSDCSFDGDSGNSSSDIDDNSDSNNSEFP